MGTRYTHDGILVKAMISSTIFCTNQRFDRILNLRFASTRQVSSIKKELPKGSSFFMAGPTGFEPAIFSVTGRRIRPAIPRARISTD